jgi:hypothetical protein
MRSWVIISLLSLFFKAHLMVGACVLINRYYCPSGSSYSTYYSCPAGRFGSTTGQTNSSCSGPCPAGRYSSSSAQTNPLCFAQCPSNYYCGIGASSPSYCGTGATSVAGSTSITACNCSTGYISIAGNGYAPCILTLNGTFVCAVLSLVIYQRSCYNSHMNG